MAAKPVAIISLDMFLMGGVERSNSDLASLLLSNGYDITLISFFKADDTPFFDFQGKTINILFNKPYRSLGFIGRAFYTFNAYFKLFRKLRRLPDGTIFISCFPRITIFLSITPFASRVVAHEHSAFEAHGWAIRWLRLKLYARLKHVITLTSHDKTIFESSNIRVKKIPNYCDLLVEPTAAAWSKKVQIQFISAGRLHWHKGFLRLLDVANAMRNEEVFFRIVGSGPEKAMLEKKIEELDLTETVALCPANKNLKSMIAESDVFLMTSVTEASPLVLFEALACSKPVVAFDCPVGPREIVVNGENGFLVPDGNVDSFVSVLMRIKQDRSLYKKLARGAQTFTLENSSRHIARMWVSVIQ